MTNKVLIIAGPTAVGKTDLTLYAARHLQGEIVSADSMQIYRGMDIGSAKPGPEELCAVPHHLIDRADPAEPYSVSRYREEALEAIRGIQSRGRLPIVSGGTGLYINSLLYEMDFSDTPSDTGFREEMARLAEREGAELLHERLRRVDPAAAEGIHPNNLKRVIRALEIAELGGARKGDFSKGPQRNYDHTFIFICLTRQRQELYDRINRRVDLMLSSGLLEEVMRLRDSGCHGGLQSMQGIGYKELLAHLEGHCSLEEAVHRIKQNTRHYAKRQLTWFKRYPEARWLDLSEIQDTESAFREITALL